MSLPLPHGAIKEATGIGYQQAMLWPDALRASLGRMGGNGVGPILCHHLPDRGGYVAHVATPVRLVTRRDFPRERDTGERRAAGRERRHLPDRGRARARHV